MADNCQNNLWSSTVSYFSIVSLQHCYAPNNVFNSKLNDTQNSVDIVPVANLCLDHSFVFHYSMICTLAAATPLFSYFLIDGVGICLLTSGTQLFAFKSQNVEKCEFDQRIIGIHIFIVLI